MTVLDASALLAFVRGESGADAVELALRAGSACSAANWSEVAQKTFGDDRDLALLHGVFEDFELAIEPVTQADAEVAAASWRRGSGLSLADRLCLALGERLDVDVLTADRTWGAKGRVKQIR